MGTHRLSDQRRIMLTSQAVSFGIFTHLCKQPAPLELDEQIIHGSERSSCGFRLAVG